MIWEAALSTVKSLYLHGIWITFVSQFILLSMHHRGVWLIVRLVIAALSSVVWPLAWLLVIVGYVQEYRRTCCGPSRHEL